MLLGALSSIKFDSVNVSKYHKKAIQLSPNDIMGHLNYAVSLHKVGKINEAVKEAKNLTKLFPNNPKAWNLYMKLALEDGCIDEALKSTHQLDRLCPNNENDSISLVSNVIFLAEKLKIPKADLKTIINFVYSLIEKHKLPIMQHNISFPLDEMSFLFEYQISQPISKVADLNDELTSLIIDSELSKEANLYFTALFTPYTSKQS